MRRSMILGTLAIFTVTAAACGGPATNNNNGSVNSANNAANSNSSSGMRHEGEMPMNGNHREMGEQHRGEHQMRDGMQTSANQNSNSNK